MSLEAQVHVELGTLDLVVDLVADPREVVAVVGPNGAGKSTLLRALAGLQPLRGGRVTLDGAVLDDVGAGVHVPTEQRSVGVLFQDALLFPHLDLADNVGFGLRCHGASRSAARAGAAEWLARVGLAGRESERAGAASGGEARRAALARTLITRPRVLLLDEPLTAVDAATRPGLRALLRRELAEHDGIRVVVTHDPVEAVVLADRLVVVEEGRVTDAGTVDEITRRPRSAYAASLVGRNLYRGTWHRDRLTVDGSAGAIGLVVAASTADAVPAFAAFRPQTVSLHRVQPSGTPRNVFRGTVASIDVIGDHVRVSVAGRVPLVAEITSAARHELALRDGDEVWAAVKASEVDVYPA